jgi:hypothetical protein
LNGVSCIVSFAIDYRQLADGTGWILDGFPVTLTQAVMLEKFLSGYDAVASNDELIECVTSIDSNRLLSKSNLVTDPRPPQPPAPAVSGIDVVIVLDIPDDVCLDRAIHMENTVATNLARKLTLTILSRSAQSKFVMLMVNFNVSSQFQL